MAFWTTEKSLTDGVPVELHQFQARGTSTYWRYADAPADVDYGGNTFTACYIEGEEIEQGSNALRNQTRVKVDWDNPYAWQYTVAAPEQVIDYTRYKAHGADVITSFIGVVIAVRFVQSDRQGKRHALILIDPAWNDLRESGLVLRSGRQCQVALYSTACGVSRGDYRTSGTILTVSGTAITSSAFGTQPIGWFRGGEFVVGNSYRKIISHTGTAIEISRAIHGLTAGAYFEAYPGCPHDVPGCRDRFDNLVNFRGQPDIPDANLWEDSFL